MSRQDTLEAEIAFERHRVASIRTFAVLLLDGSEETVRAHSWTSTDAGHIAFQTVTAGRLELTHDLFAMGTFRRVKEVTPIATRRYIDWHARQSRGYAEMLDARPPKKHNTSTVH